MVVAGIYTHFHFSKNDRYVNWQFQKFRTILDELAQRGLEIPVKMASATPAILRHPYMHLNAVDPGRLIVGNPAGVQPIAEVELKPVFRSLKTKIIEKKIIKPPTEFIDDAVFPITRDTMVGVIPIGWGDGYSRAHASEGPALVRGKRVSVLNGIHYEHTRIDLTDVPDAAVGDEVVLIGKQGEAEITLEEIGKIRNTDLHSVCQSVRNHIPFLYFRNEKPYKLKTILGDSML
jgi:alanine racemase